MKRIKFPIREKIKACGIACCTLLAVSCNSFLDIVPDNIPVIDHAFTNAMEAEKFLFTCYSYLPGSGEPSGNIGMTAGDEIWLNMPNHVASPAWDYIAKGVRSADRTQPNFWSGSDYTYPLFMAIRDCNIFLENVEDTSKVADLTVDKRARWIAEVKFLKAFYHYYLLRTYGPIPIVDKNLPVSASPEEVQVKRRPFDECVRYIVDLLDECNPDLPSVIANKQSELGRITKPINRALKAKVLLLAASPQFNGNSDYANFRNHDGELLFTPDPDPDKWALAADAAKEAIESAESAGHELFYFKDAPFEISETTKTQLSIRQAICERWNKEVVWGRSGGRGRAGAALQNACMPLLDGGMNINTVRGCIAPTLAIVEEFYTKNGVPIDEDKTLNFTKINELRTATAVSVIISNRATRRPGLIRPREPFLCRHRFRRRQMDNGIPSVAFGCRHLCAESQEKSTGCRRGERCDLLDRLFHQETRTLGVRFRKYDDRRSRIRMARNPPCGGLPDVCRSA